MTNRFPRWLKVTLGIFLILFGTVGHLIPLLPGFLFIAAGALLLAEVSPKLQRRLTMIESHYPKVRVVLQKIRKPDGTLDLSKIALPMIAIALFFTLFGYLFYRFVPWK